MATKSGRGSQAVPFPRGRKALAKFRHDVAELKAKGLVSSRVNARSQWPTEYMRQKLSTYKDVLGGKAKVVSMPSIKEARDIGSGKLRRFGKKVVVPVTNKTERVRYNAKLQAIISTSQENGRKLRKVLREKNVDLYDINSYPRGDGIRYRIPFAHGGYLQFDTPEDLFAALFEYESKTNNPYKNIYDFVQIIYDGGDLDGDGESDDW